jgi:polyhydroxyalkanoate synthesis repressor PhaR
MQQVNVIKRYSNRKLYDTEISSYITLSTIFQKLKEGRQIKIVDYSVEGNVDVTGEVVVRAILNEAEKPDSINLRNLIVSAISHETKTGG